MGINFFYCKNSDSDHPVDDNGQTWTDIMAENALSHVLLLCITDLNASQTQGPQTSIPNQESIQPSRVDALLLSHQPESLQDEKDEDRVEEKIVYLWWLIF